MGRENDAEESRLIEVRTRVPERAFSIISELVAKGFYSSVADFARQSILDKLIDDFELGMSELAPDVLAEQKGIIQKKKAEEKGAKGPLQA